jgi:hypothetical protein
MPWSPGLTARCSKNSSFFAQCSKQDHRNRRSSSGLMVLLALDSMGHPTPRPVSGILKLVLPVLALLGTLKRRPVRRPRLL